MNIQSVYDVGQKVHSIKEENTKVWARCGFCVGSDGPISVLNLTTITGRNGEILRCPVCRGSGGSWKYVGKIWVVDEMLTIGRVEVRVSQDEIIESYMCHETGVGSGRVWSPNKLCPTREDALAVCNFRNTTTKEK